MGERLQATRNTNENPKRKHFLVIRKGNARMEALAKYEENASSKSNKKNRFLISSLFIVVKHIFRK